MSQIISILPAGYGHFEVTILLYGKPRTFTTTNTLAIDRYRSDDDRIDRGKFYTTPKQAERALIREYRRKI